MSGNAKDEDDLIEYVCSLPNSINAMSQAICNQGESGSGLGRNEIQIVKKEIKSELSDTKDSIEEQKEMMKSFISRSQ